MTRRHWKTFVRHTCAWRLVWRAQSVPQWKCVTKPEDGSEPNGSGLKCKEEENSWRILRTASSAAPWFSGRSERRSYSLKVKLRPRLEPSVVGDEGPALDTALDGILPSAQEQKPEENPGRWKPQNVQKCAYVFKNKYLIWYGDFIHRPTDETHHQVLEMLFTRF